MKKGIKYKVRYLAERAKRKELEVQLEKARRESSDSMWRLFLLLLFAIPPERENVGNEKEAEE